MTNEYEWIDDRDEFKRDFGSGDALLGWVIYAFALLYLVI